MSESNVNIGISETGVKALDVVAAEIIKAKRSQTFWTRIKIAALILIFAFAMIGSAYDQYSASKNNIVAIVKISGVIGEGSGSADAIIPALKKAFKRKDAVAVVLSIDSPGGSPTDADRISQSLIDLKAEFNKPVISIIDGVGASAAYMIAIHTDKIIAGKYSMIGSIGVVIQAWDYHEIMDKVGLKQRVFASGELKSMLNPYAAMSKVAEAKAQEIVDGMARQFVADVKKARGKKLRDMNWFTGEVWAGDESMELGLIDEVGTLESYLKKTYDDPIILPVTPRMGSGFLGMSEGQLLVAEKAMGVISSAFNR